jgi:hypothetical protein
MSTVVGRVEETNGGGDDDEPSGDGDKKFHTTHVL